jgi:hypothetical protein
MLAQSAPSIIYFKKNGNLLEPHSNQNPSLASTENLLTFIDVLNSETNALRVINSFEHSTPTGGYNNCELILITR